MAILRSLPNRTAALRDERLEVLRFCAHLTDEEWSAPSAAAGWQLRDVMAHIGSGCHSLFTPSAATVLFSKDIERTNDQMVQARRSWKPERVLDEYTRWSARVAWLSSMVGATPVGRLRIPLAELGKFPLDLLLGGAMVFDQHTHLRFDMAPAIGRAAPPTDANRMSVVVEWMLAVLSNQLSASPPEWMQQPLRLTLTGLGGGAWSIGTDGAITSGLGSGAAGAEIVATAEQFPEWATRRAPWRDRVVTIGGNHEYGERFLDAINIV